MMTLFDQDTVMELWLYNEKKESREEGLAEGLEKGMEKGMEKGRAEGVLRTMWNLVSDGLLDQTVAAGRLNMTVEEFRAAAASL